MFHLEPWDECLNFSADVIRFIYCRTIVSFAFDDEDSVRKAVYGAFEAEIFEGRASNHFLAPSQLGRSVMNVFLSHGDESAPKVVFLLAILSVAADVKKNESVSWPFFLCTFFSPDESSFFRAKKVDISRTFKHLSVSLFVSLSFSLERELKSKRKRNLTAQPKH